MNKLELKNALGELVMYQEKEILRLEKLLSEGISFKSVADEIRLDIEEIKERKIMYSKTLRGL